MHTSKSFSVGLLVALLALAVLPLGMAAADIDAGFSVSAVHPANQIDGSAAYFDLMMEPKETQDLVVRVENPNQEEITVTVETVTASTNRNGIISYSATGLSDETLRQGFADLSTVEEPRIIIPGNATREAKVSLTMPEEEYSGLLLGAIRIVKLPDDAEPAGETGVVNQYSYAIGVRLRVGNAAVVPDFDLGRVEAGMVNHKAAIVANIRNPEPVMVEGLNATAQVFQMGAEEPMLSLTQEDVEMAPQSVFPMSLVDQEGYGFPPGEYRFTLNLNHEGRNWDFQQDFTIQEEQAAVINGNAVNQNAPVVAQKPVIWPYIIIGCFAVAVILGIAKRRGWL